MGLVQCGMKINQAKSHTVSIVGLGKEKKTVVNARPTFTIDDLPIRALSRADGWTYLGISFTPEGRSTANLKTKLVPLLDRLTKAPLKPQQRLFALKVFLLPKVYHHMVLGRVTISSLNEIDKTIRGFVSQCYRLS